MTEQYELGNFCFCNFMHKNIIYIFHMIQDFVSYNDLNQAILIAETFCIRICVAY